MLLKRAGRRAGKGIFAGIAGGNFKAKKGNPDCGRKF